jgi:hypothetical protein
VIRSIPKGDPRHRIRRLLCFRVRDWRAGPIPPDDDVGERIEDGGEDGRYDCEGESNHPCSQPHQLVEEEDALLGGFQLARADRLQPIPHHRDQFVVCEGIRAQLYDVLGEII